MKIKNDLHKQLFEEFEKERKKSFSSFKLPYDVADYNRFEEECIEWLADKVISWRMVGHE